MPAFPREGRIKKLNEELEEARSDATLLRASQMRLLQTLSERDQAVHERDLAEGELARSRDQFRISNADRVLKHGPYVFSDADQQEAYLHADQVQFLPTEDGGLRVSLLDGVALRELPKKPLAAAPPPTDTPGTPDAEGTADSTDEAPSLHAVGDPDASKEPLPS